MDMLYNKFHRYVVWMCAKLTYRFHPLSHTHTHSLALGKQISWNTRQNTHTHTHSHTNASFAAQRVLSKMHLSL